MEATLNRKEFFQTVLVSIDADKIEDIIDAYHFAKAFHRDQKRDAGGRYFDHCISVALNLIDHGPTDAYEIKLALLHDVPEDQYVTDRLLRTLFGNDIADDLKVLSRKTYIADEFGEIVKTKKDNSDYYQALASSSIKVRRVKLSDRDHNLSTMSTWNIEKQIQYVEGTEQDILPLADCPECMSFKETIEKGIVEFKLRNNL